MSWDGEDELDSQKLSGLIVSSLTLSISLALSFCFLVFLLGVDMTETSPFSSQRASFMMSDRNNCNTSCKIRSASSFLSSFLLSSHVLQRQELYSKNSGPYFTKNSSPGFILHLNLSWTMPQSLLKSYSQFGLQSEFTNRIGPRRSNCWPVLSDDLSKRSVTTPSGTGVTKPIGYRLKIAGGQTISVPSYNSL